MPACTRASATSRVNSSSRVQRRTAPLAVGLLVLSTGSAAPARSASSTTAMLTASVLCALGYSGCIGVSTSGDHAASGCVASLPSMSPLRIAVTGRQKL